MPIYEYQCQSCGRRSEALQSLNDPPLVTCTECGGVLRKLVSSPAFQFKGTGWYVTDYGGKDGGKGAGKDDGKESGKAANEGGKETKGAEGGEGSQKPAESAPKEAAGTAEKKPPAKAVEP